VSDISIVAGYILPQERDRRRFRIGFSYYNGRCIGNQYYNRRERFLGFSFGFDL
jgi:hypothetical protein